MRLFTRTGYAWNCDACQIKAGDPDQPFGSLTDAQAALDQHITDSHHGITPDDETWAGDIAWRRFRYLPTLVR